MVDSFSLRMAQVHTQLQWMMQLVCLTSLFLMLYVATSPRTNSRSGSISEEECRRIFEIKEGHREKRETKAPKEINNFTEVHVPGKEFGKAIKPVLPQKLEVKQKAQPKAAKPLPKTSGNLGTAFKEFIKLRPHKTIGNHFEFIVSGQRICADKDGPFLVVICVSDHYNMDQREIIRKTWASAAKTGTWPLHRGNVAVKIVFVLGNRGTSAVKRAIVKEETEKFRDIVLVNVDESFHSRSKRVLAGLQWVKKHCSKAKFILKVNENTMVHLPNLIAYLRPFKIPQKGLLIGYVYPNTKVLRGGDLAVNQTLYPFEIYPPYLDGGSYVISGNVISKLLNAAEHLPYIFIENVFITGIAREAVGAEIKHKAEFASKHDRISGLCSLHTKGRISVTNIKASIQLLIWEALKHETCIESS